MEQVHLTISAVKSINPSFTQRLFGIQIFYLATGPFAPVEMIVDLSNIEDVTSKVLPDIATEVSDTVRNSKCCPYSVIKATPTYT